MSIEKIMKLEKRKYRSFELIEFCDICMFITLNYFSVVSKLLISSAKYSWN